MKERPILFSGEMVRAILDGQKTQTRRIIKPQPVMYDFGSQKEWAFVDPNTIKGYMAVGVSAVNKGSTGLIKNGYNVKGGLWVRETHWIGKQDDILVNGLRAASGGESIVHYRATEGSDADCWKPSIHMPRWACRLELEITGVRVELLNAISEEDAIAEGCQCAGVPAAMSNAGAFAKLWERINGEGSWAVNPWVWALTFKRIT